MRAAVVLQTTGLGLIQPIELRVVRELARLDEARVILLRAPLGALVATAVKERLALAREHDDARRVDD